MLAATDPANPYGSALRWPKAATDAGTPQRVANARVVLWDGHLVGYLGRGGDSLSTFLAAAEPERGRQLAGLLSALKNLSRRGEVLYLSKVDGLDTQHAAIAPDLLAMGFVPSSKGFLLRANKD